MSRIRVGVIGTGNAARAHVDALRRLPEVELAGIASRDPERAAGAARRLGAGSAYRDPSELIDDPSVDAVHVCTINRLHAGLCAEALAAGKHVVAEKPLGTNSESTARLAEAAAAAARAGTMAAVCLQNRHYGLIPYLKAALASGEYGDPHLVHGSYLQDWMLYETDWDWRVEPGDNGASRVIADIGSHIVDLAEHVTGDRVRAVRADLGTLHAVRQRPLAAGDSPVPVGNEDFATLMVRFAGGARGTFVLSQVSAGRADQLRFEVDMSAGAVAWSSERPDSAWLGSKRAPNRELLRGPDLSVPMPGLPGGLPEGSRDAVRNLCADFYEVVAARRDGEARRGTFATFADGHHLAAVVDAALESDRDDAWVEVADCRAASGAAA